MGDQGGDQRTWSTVGREDAFVQWRDVVCQAYTRLSPERTHDGPFAGEIRLTPIGDGGSLSRITASPQRVSRGRAEIAASPCDAVFVNIQVSGHSVVRQRDAEARLAPGSLTMIDARRPFAMRFDTPFRQVCLHLPIAWLAAQGLDPAASPLRRIDRETEFGGALMRYVEELVDPDAAAAPAEETGRTLVHLLHLAHAGDRPDLLADRHLALLRRFVAEHCADPDLTPTAVAGHFRISKRYLHKLFARSGESFGRYLLRCRLEASRRALSDRREQGSILDIALAAGFNDPSHFARSFRRRFGVSPSRLRRAMTGDPRAPAPETDAG